MPIETPPPKYTTIINAVQARIEAGTYPAGALLPSEAALSREFDASRSTVVRALEYLRQRGWLEGQQGRGRVVIGVPPAKSPVPQRLHAMLTSGEPSIGTLLKVGPVPANSSVAAALRVPDRTTVVARHLLVCGNAGPTELRTVYAPATLATVTGLTSRQPLRDGLLANLRRRGMATPNHIAERICARPPTAHEAALLEVGQWDCFLTALWTLRDELGRSMLAVEAAIPCLYGVFEDTFPVP